ncbi:unnamed protein product [Brachionus calyciflorus]|uniref:Uncharacterized protein n=1 Tax=Brachionus calyciflorus TaxID=104777 RepID=A0A814IID6_9BILA|nr:unnamed protein product [Brachionus calyciflorus]
METLEGENSPGEKVEIIPLEIESKRSVKKILKRLKKLETNDRVNELPPVQKTSKKSDNPENEKQNVQKLPELLENKNLPNLPNLPDLPNFLKDSIEKKAESFVSFDIYKKVDFDKYFNLKNFKNFIDKLKADEKLIKNLNFNSIVCLTDAVFYIFLKFFNNKELWLNLDRVTLDSCRYITDFGIRLLNEATGKKMLIDESSSSGCKRINSYFYPTIEDDIFLSEKFNNLDMKDENDDKIELNSYKVTIINETNSSLVNFLTNNSFENKKLSYDFTQINTKKLNFNIFEVESFHNTQHPAYSFNITPSSILIIFIDFSKSKNQKEFIDDLTNRILEILNQDVRLLKLMLVIKSCIIEKEEILKSLKENLLKSIKTINDDEIEFLNSIDKVKFFEQETFRDKFRLKFSVEKFIADPSIEIVILSNDDSNEKLINQISNGLGQRYKSQLFKNLSEFLSETDKKILKFEEFIDSCLTSNKNNDFKYKIQEQIKHRNLMENYFYFKNYLGECLLFKIGNGQLIIIPNIKWFVNAIEKIREFFTTSKDLTYDSAKNIYMIPQEPTKLKELLKQINLDNQNYQILIEILISMNKLTQTGTKNFYLLDNKFMVKKSNKTFTDFWPQSTNGSLELRLILSLFYKLPEYVLNDIKSKYTKLLNIFFMNKNCIICREGSINMCVVYDESKKQLSVMAQCVDLTRLINQKEFSDSQKNVNKMIITLFNEYKIVLEATLLNYKIPFRYTQTKIDGLKQNGKIYTNIEDDFIETLNIEPENLLTCNHKFKQVDAENQKCKNCSIDSEWSKLVHHSFRSVLPMVKANNFWNLYVNQNGSLNLAKTDKFLNGEIFNVGTEFLELNGTHRMSPYDFNSYSTFFTSDFQINRCEIGVRIKNNSDFSEIKVLMCCKSRRIILRRLKSSYDDYIENLVENQRYKNIKLLEEIRMNVRRNDGNNTISLNQLYAWHILPSDSVTVQLIQE